MLTMLSLLLLSCDEITKDKSTLVLTTGVYRFQQDENSDPQPLNLANYSYRPRGRVNGIWKNIFIDRLEISDDYITIFFQNAASGGAGYAFDYDTNGWQSSGPNRPALIDVETQEFVINVGETHNGAGYIQSVVFPRELDTMKFNLKKNIGLDTEMVFTQINLRKAVYKRD